MMDLVERIIAYRDRPGRSREGRDLLADAANEITRLRRTFKTMSTPTEMLACVERELKYRARVYPRLVEGGKMSMPQADYEIRTMESVAEHLRRMTEAEQPMLALNPAENGH
jgi:hypothetical protein